MSNNEHDCNTEKIYSIPRTKRLYEIALILSALEDTGNNKTKAAKLLEISHRSLLYKIVLYGLGEPSYGKTPPIHIVPVRMHYKGTGKHVHVSGKGHPYADGRKQIFKRAPCNRL